MRTKKIMVSCADYESFKEIVENIKNIGIEVIETRYDVIYRRYDIITKMTRSQATDVYLLKENGDYNFIMWKGEP